MNEKSLVGAAEEEARPGDEGWEEEHKQNSGASSLAANHRCCK